MPLTTSAKIEAHLGLSVADAARVFRHVDAAELYLRRLKGNLWYDAIVLSPAPGEVGLLDDTPPVVTLSQPEAGEVSNPVWIVGTATDDGEVVALEYRWDGGPWLDLPHEGAGASVAYKHAVTLPLSDDARALDVRATDGEARTTTATVLLQVVAAETFPGGEVPYPEEPAPWLERLRAERAESLLCLYYALPHLNLRLDADGGVITTSWETDPVTGARVQTEYASPARLEGLRLELLGQAKLLVDGDVRVSYDALETTLLDSVSGFAGGAGYLSVI